MRDHIEFPHEERFERMVNDPDAYFAEARERARAQLKWERLTWRRKTRLKCRIGLHAWRRCLSGAKEVGVCTTCGRQR